MEQSTDTIKTSGKRYMDPKQAGDYLGVSKWTIYRLVDDRASGIPFIKIRSILRFDPLALDEWMKKSTVKFPVQ